MASDASPQAEALIASHYRRWGDLAQLSRLTDGWDNDNFLVQNRTGRRAVLRRYNLSNDDEVRAETELLKVLNRVRFPTPPLVRSDANDVTQRFAGATWVMSDYVPDTRYPTRSEWPIALELMQKLHVVGAGFRGPSIRQRFRGLSERLERIPAGQLEAGDLEFLKKVIEEERSRFGAMLDQPGERVRSSCVHYDVNPRNVLIDAQQSAWLIDFDEFVFAPITVDLAGFIHYWCISDAGDFDAAHAREVVAAYSSRSALTAEEVARLPGELLRYQLRDCLKYCLNELAESPRFQLRQSTSFLALRQIHAVVCQQNWELEHDHG